MEDPLYEKPELRVTKEPSLVIYDSHLAYHFVISHEGPESGRWWYYVDAHTGELITHYNNISYCTPTSNGSYVTVEGERLAGEGGGYVEITGWHDSNDGNYYLYNDSIAISGLGDFLRTPAQKAVVVWDNNLKKETLVLTTSFGIDSISSFCWVVPILSTQDPTVDASNKKYLII